MGWGLAHTENYEENTDSMNNKEPYVCFMPDNKTLLLAKKFYKFSFKNSFNFFY